MPILLKCIRIGFVSKDYFVQKIKCHEYVKENDECKTFVIEALKYLYELELDIEVNTQNYKLVELHYEY